MKTWKAFVEKRGRREGKKGGPEGGSKERRAKREKGRKTEGDRERETEREGKRKAKRRNENRERGEEGLRLRADRSPRKDTRLVLPPPVASSWSQGSWRLPSLDLPSSLCANAGLLACSSIPRAP